MASSPRRGDGEVTSSKGDAHRDAVPDPEPSVMQLLVAEYTEDDAEDMSTALTVSAVGVGVECVLHPLETVSSRAKVLPPHASSALPSLVRHVYHSEGIRGLYAGVSVTLFMSLPSTLLYFAGYHMVKDVGLEVVPPSLHPAVHFVAGGVAELCSSLVFVPMDVVRTRLQLGRNAAAASGGVIPASYNYSSARQALGTIARTEGLRGLYAGWGSCLAQDCLFSAVLFVVYEQCKRVWLRSPHHDRATLPISDSAACGGLAGGVAALVTNPIDTLTTRLQTQGSTRGFGRGIFGVVRNMWQEGGSSFWRGSLPRMLHFGPLAAVQFTMYESALRVMYRP